MDSEFGRAAQAIVAGHQHDPVQPLTVAPLHVRQECPERLLAALGFTLVDIVRDIV
jgi:hypothetical protein